MALPILFSFSAKCSLLNGLSKSIETISREIPSIRAISWGRGDSVAFFADSSLWAFLASNSKKYDRELSRGHGTFYCQLHRTMRRCPGRSEHNIITTLRLMFSSLQRIRGA